MWSPSAPAISEVRLNALVHGMMLPVAWGLHILIAARDENPYAQVVASALISAGVTAISYGVGTGIKYQQKYTGKHLEKTGAAQEKMLLDNLKRAGNVLLQEHRLKGKKLKKAADSIMKELAKPEEEAPKETTATWASRIYQQAKSHLFCRRRKRRGSDEDGSTHPLTAAGSTATSPADPVVVVVAASAPAAAPEAGVVAAAPPSVAAVSVIVAADAAPAPAPAPVAATAAAPSSSVQSTQNLDAQSAIPPGNDGLRQRRTSTTDVRRQASMGRGQAQGGGTAGTQQPTVVAASAEATGGLGNIGRQASVDMGRFDRDISGAVIGGEVATGALPSPRHRASEAGTASPSSPRENSGWRCVIS